MLNKQNGCLPSVSLDQDKKFRNTEVNTELGLWPARDNRGSSTTLPSTENIFRTINENWTINRNLVQSLPQERLRVNNNKKRDYSRLFIHSK